MGSPRSSPAIAARPARDGEAARWGQAEFADAFRAHFRTLWLIACGVTRHVDLAEDVVQESAIVALQKLNDFDPQTSFPAWMGQIVRFVAMNHARRERRRHGAPLDGIAEPMGKTHPPQPEPGQSFDPNWFDDSVLAALGEIGETARACLLLRTVQGLSYAEIAAALDVPAGTAMSHVFRSRQTLRRLLANSDEYRQ